MRDLPLVVDVLLVAGALSTALGAIAAIGVKALRAVRNIDEHFRRRETDRIEQAASRIVEQAAQALGGRLDQLAATVDAIDRRQRDDDRRRSAELASWEMWRAGVDGRLDLLDEECRRRSQSR